MKLRQKEKAQSIRHRTKAKGQYLMMKEIGRNYDNGSIKKMIILFEGNHSISMTLFNRGSFAKSYWG
jgi:hypothetical protein